jgi:hypothetical protein
VTIEEREREPLTRLVVIFDVTPTSILKFCENSILFSAVSNERKTAPPETRRGQREKKNMRKQQQKKVFFVVVAVKKYNLTAKERKAIYLQWR